MKRRVNGGLGPNPEWVWSRLTESRRDRRQLSLAEGTFRTGDGRRKEIIRVDVHRSILLVHHLDNRFFLRAAAINRRSSQDRRVMHREKWMTTCIAASMKLLLSSVINQCFSGVNGLLRSLS
jgi:hypothetical protein